MKLSYYIFEDHNYFNIQNSKLQLLAVKSTVNRICTCKLPVSVKNMSMLLSNLVQWLVGFPDGSVEKESACNSGDLGSIPRLGRCLGKRNSYPLQYSGLEKSMDCIVHEVTKSQTRLSDFHFHFILSCNSQPFPNTSSTHCKDDAPFHFFCMNFMRGSSSAFHSVKCPLCIR